MICYNIKITIQAQSIPTILYTKQKKYISENNSDVLADDNADKIKVKTVDKAENKIVENQVQTETISKEENCTNREEKP